ncbi:MAG: zinc ribbon domain-containing protein [Nanoarchaeota archaeon]|nr:zinc ribbon domain-containing protein [Nanoarchaeota archaeon]
MLEGIAKKERKPNIRLEPTFTSWNYYFTCDICGTEYGPKGSKMPQIDGGMKFLRTLYMHCPACGQFICKPRCWNYNQGKCLSCAPSKEIAMSRMVPKVRGEHKIPMWHYYFTCDVCDYDYGPEKSMSKQADNGLKIIQKHFRQCPICGKFVCRSQCWNYEKGTCTVCNALTPPEYIVTQEKLRSNYYLICSICRKQLGPISEVDWDKVKKIAMGSAKIALGVVTGGAAAISGVADIAFAAKGGEDVKKMAREVATEAKTDLAKCPSCSRWVCIEECWDKDKGVCKACATEKTQQPIQPVPPQPSQAYQPPQQPIPQITQPTTQTPQIQYCPFCGKKLQPDWQVCGYCGKKLKGG